MKASLNTRRLRTFFYVFKEFNLVLGTIRNVYFAIIQLVIL